MAQDQTSKRRNIATNAVTHCTNFLTALTNLIELSAQRGQSGDFVDADFEGTDLRHLTPGIVGTLFDFVVPSINTNFIDSANGNRNENIIRQMLR